MDFLSFTRITWILELVLLTVRLPMLTFWSSVYYIISNLLLTNRTFVLNLPYVSQVWSTQPFILTKNRGREARSFSEGLFYVTSLFLVQFHTGNSMSNLCWLGPVTVNSVQGSNFWSEVLFILSWDSKEFENARSLSRSPNNCVYGFVVEVSKAKVSMSFSGFSNMKLDRGSTTTTMQKLIGTRSFRKVDTLVHGSFEFPYQGAVGQYGVNYRWYLTVCVSLHIGFT